MKMIQIISDNTTNQKGSEYRSVELSSEKQSISVLSVSGNHSYVNVTVNNASHKVWRGAGKVFGSIEDAISNYKSADVKAMLEYVREGN
jgi:DNA-binding protein H-NS